MRLQALRRGWAHARARTASAVLRRLGPSPVVGAVLGFSPLVRRALATTPSAAEPVSTRAAALAWLLRAQEVQGDGGVSAWLELYPATQWYPSYPEVAGYIIPTLLDAAPVLGDVATRAAMRIARFELSIQMPSGAFPAGFVGRPAPGRVFNTGQVIHGLVRAFTETGCEECLAAAQRAAAWVTSVQEPDGSWVRHNYLQRPRVYDAKVDQALLELNAVRPDGALVRAAQRNLEFVCSRQRTDGWFDDCGDSRTRNAAPLTHTIGYTIQGLLESGRLLGDDTLLAAAERALGELAESAVMPDGAIAGRLGPGFAPRGRFVCTAGSAQLAACFLAMDCLRPRVGYRAVGERVLGFLVAHQLRGLGPDLDGALPASLPLWGEYMPFAVNSWTMKYFADALQLQGRDGKPA